MVRDIVHLEHFPASDKNFKADLALYGILSFGGEVVMNASRGLASGSCSRNFAAGLATAKRSMIA
jgi:hypothetical protein